EKYLRQCLESLVSQSYENLELILVAGTGDDACIKICEEYEKKDDRIKLITEEPKGTASARNSGLEAACGDYIGFVDGDDYIKSDMIESLVKVLEDNGADIAVSGKYYLYENCIEPDFPEHAAQADAGPASGLGGGGEHGTGEKADAGAVPGVLRILSRQEAFSTILYQNGFFLHIWDKLYKRELFDDIRFDSGKKVEDRFVCYRLLNKASKIAYLRQPKYYFRMSADSGSKVEDNLAKSFEADKLICNEILKDYPSLLAACDFFIVYEAISVIQNSMLYGNFSKEHDKDCLEIVRTFYKSVYNNREVSKQIRIKIFLCVHFPRILKKFTINRRKKFLSTHKLFSSGVDWNRVFDEQKIS
nr:glycosyltransferase [Lachnospiraceae bacterium]